MARSSPVKPLQGRSVLSGGRFLTLYDEDGTPRANLVRQSERHSDPTYTTALRLIEAQRRLQHRVMSMKRRARICAGVSRHPKRDE